MNRFDKITRNFNEHLPEMPGCSDPLVARTVTRNDSGFSLIEAAIALVILLVALLGVFMTITYAITYNTGNNSRAQAVAVLQQEVERMRSAKFTPSRTDPPLLGGQTVQTVTMNGLPFRVTTTINNDPFSRGYIESTTRLKEITVRAEIIGTRPGEWRAAVPATVVLRRVKAN